MGCRLSLNLNQILFMGNLLLSNYKRNIRNIICNAQGWKNRIFVGIGGKNYPDWIWMVATQVTNIPFRLSFLKTSLKHHIGDMVILLSLIIQGITPNAMITQTNKISCGATHQI